MDNNQEWVDSLKVGDKVAMDVGSFGHSRYAIATITKITPKRRITTSNGRTFNTNGSEYGKQDTWARRTHLKPVTQDIKDRIERSHLLQEMKTVKFEELTTDQLRSLVSHYKSLI